MRGRGTQARPLAAAFSGVMATVLALSLAASAWSQPEARPAPAGSAPGKQRGGASTTTERPIISGALSLDRAVETALRESPVVRGAVEEVNVAVQELRAAQAQRRPILSTTTFVSGGSNANITTTPAPVMPQMVTGLPRDTFFDQNLSLMVPLYTGGRLQALVRRAEAARSASSADLAEMKLEVALMTRTAYRQAQVRQAFLAVYQDLTRTNQERLRIDQISFREGRIAQYPVLRDEAELASAAQQLTNAQRDLEMALVQLRTVMGVRFAPDVSLDAPPPFRPIQDLLPTLLGEAYETPRGTAAAPLPDRAATPPPAPGATASAPAAPAIGDPGPLGGPSPELERLLQQAALGRPVLEAQRLRLQASGQDIRAARSAYRPQISLFAMGDAMRGRSIDTLNGYTAGVVIGLPILDGGMRRAEVRRAEAEKRRQDQELQRVLLQVEQEVTNNWLAVRAAERNVATAQAGVRAAEEDYRLAQVRYEAGRSINVEALDALAARTRARVDLAQALFEYQLAADQLRRSIGRE